MGVELLGLIVAWGLSAPCKIREACNGDEGARGAKRPSSKRLTDYQGVFREFLIEALGGGAVKVKVEGICWRS